MKFNNKATQQNIIISTETNFFQFLLVNTQQQSKTMHSQLVNIFKIYRNCELALTKTRHVHHFHFTILISTLLATMKIVGHLIFLFFQMEEAKNNLTNATSLKLISSCDCVNNKMSTIFPISINYHIACDINNAKTFFLFFLKKTKKTLKGIQIIEKWDSF